METKSLIKTDVAGMYVDPVTKAVVNTDEGALTAIRLQRKRDRESQTIHADVAALRREVAELRAMIERANVKSHC